ncbi:HlyD family type I secretion periplasmic adaptor subunit [Novosphingobium colocasiae]|uniref:Membrane fusion protein (MFP) family protein n=1 Tax=Novosphingobium colocasiae TaxID=1256513 RepID=A0A918PEY5_9SPHN|nr:HlyD family type I secretion periplasmic adaptor subunit [Novosphingobium colocasiae]GGZ01385.1 HlyD family type I secretion periplasmic adaptor subunit [Novosphingobium colocasiae]
MPPLPFAVPSSGDPAAAADDPDLRVAHGIRTARHTLALVGLAAFVGLVLVPIGGAVVASGQVGVESRVKRIAHPTGGVVARILVANGDHVERDQSLVQLDDSVSGAENLYSNLTVAQMLAQRARLDAERMGAPAITFPAELLSSRDPGAQAAMASERRLFLTRNAELAQSHAQLDARASQYQRQIAGFTAQISALRKQQALIAPEREGVRTLWDKGLVTISRLNQLERTSVDIEGSIASLQAQIAEAEARISETREQALTLKQSRRAEAGAQFASLSNTINDQQIKRAVAAAADDRAIVRAPYAGIVDKLALTAVGDVIRPGEPFMEIVPDRDRLTVEVMISPADIDQVHVGQAARVKFTAFNSTATPELEGRLTYLAPERSTNPDTRQSFYEARIAIAPQTLRRHPEMVLKPGMPAEVFISTSTRSMLSYITKPLRDQLGRAFRDN